MNEKLLEQKAEEYLESEAKPYSLSSCTLCDVKNWGGKEPKDRYYSEPNVIGFLTKFAEQETKLLSEHIIELQADKGRAYEHIAEQRATIAKQTVELVKLQKENKEAIELIRAFLNLDYVEFICSENVDYEEVDKLKKRAEQFLGE